YSTVLGMATEVDVLRALGFQPSARDLVRRRRQLLDFLRSALGVDLLGAAPRSPALGPAPPTRPADPRPPRPRRPAARGEAFGRDGPPWGSDKSRPKGADAALASRRGVALGPGRRTP